MRTHILLIISVVLCEMVSCQIKAQRPITGQVVEEANRQPLTGVLIYTNDGVSVLSDQQGYFELTPTEKSNVLITSYLSYHSDTTPISTIDSSLLIALKEQSTSLEEIIVRSNLTSYKKGFVGSNYRLSPQKVANRNALETGELIRTIPGVNMVGDMGLGNRPNISIRGSWGRRSKKILLLEDGSPAAPAPYVAPGAYYNAVSDRVQSVEVYKGADMLRYGPNNMFGAVNFITAKPPQQPQARIRLVGGQRNYMTGLLSYGGTWDKLGVLVEGVYKRFDGFRQNSAVEMANLNAKIFAELNDQQSLYFKVSGQIEDNQASLSSITPYTFNIDPLQNPFDADQFTMQRLGLDVIHKYVSPRGFNLKSKIYTSSFERDWWRQVTDVVRAQEVRSYLGEDIFEDRYSYLQNETPGNFDYVRVGRVVNGRESTTDSRWAFSVFGLKETLAFDWQRGEYTHRGEVGFNTHFETFSDRLLRADSSRWARTEDIEKDLFYQVWATNAYARLAFQWGNFTLTPIYRLEHVQMFRQDRKSASLNPNLGEAGGPKERNNYWISQPGISLNYDFGNSELYGSVYRGFIAPSKVFGFLVERNGVVVNPLEGESINIEPEISTNAELGWKGELIPNRLSGQITGFQTQIENFYAAGRNEVFEELGTIRTRGIELSLTTPLISKQNHYL
ncbi:MAG: TonB-dependent receptor plug domain-containing protein, partial [Bacteroidetes bacterium]|nr:TonB-dependent receptor plug domain-containing protein [Bacteroidota bacterium]